MNDRDHDVPDDAFIDKVFEAWANDVDRQLAALDRRLKAIEAFVATLEMARDEIVDPKSANE